MADLLPDEPDPGGLWKKTQLFMAGSGRTGTPLTYIQQQLTHRIHRHISRTDLSAAIIGGDFNAGYHPGEACGGHLGLREWAEQSLLCNPNGVCRGERGHTFTRNNRGVSSIDHLLHTDRGSLRATKRLVIGEAAWNVSDHRPLMQEYILDAILQPYINNRARTKRLVAAAVPRVSMREEDGDQLIRFRKMVTD